MISRLAVGVVDHRDFEHSECEAFLAGSLAVIASRREVGAVIRGFVCNRNVMRMVLSYTGCRHADKAGVGSQFFDCLCSAIPHSGSKATDQLVNVIGQVTFIGNTSFNAFWYKFSISGLAISFTGAFNHCSHRSHSSVGLK